MSKVGDLWASGWSVVDIVKTLSGGPRSARWMGFMAEKYAAHNIKYIKPLYVSSRTDVMMYNGFSLPRLRCLDKPYEVCE